MTGLGEEVYVPQQTCGVDEMVEMAAAQIAAVFVAAGSDQPQTKDIDRHSARAALESLGIPLETLAATKAGTWQAVPKASNFAMQCAAIDTDNFKLGDISPLGFRISPQQMFARCWTAMLDAAPKTPEAAHD